MASPQERTKLVVHCQDVERGVVSRTLRKDCAGRIVDADTARQIRFKRARARAERAAVGRGQAASNRVGRTGTGFVVDPVGYVLTAYHVIQGCDALSVTRNNRSRRTAATSAHVVATSRIHDLALLKTRRLGDAVVPQADLKPPTAGAPIRILGYPTHDLASSQPTAVDGAFSKLAARVRDRESAVLAEATVVGGYSGSPLIDAEGRLRGLVVGKIDPVTVYHRTGRTIPDHAIAVAVPTIVDFLRSHDIDLESVGAASSGPIPTTLRIVCFSSRS